MSKPKSIIYGIEIKKQLLNETHNANVAHRRWIRKINYLVDNLPVDIQELPIDLSKSEFAQWLYTSGIKCKKIPELEYYISLIEFLHTEIHNSYLKIHTIYYAHNKPPRLINMLTLSHKKVSEKQLKIARFYLNDIEALSKELFTFLDQFERHLAIQANEKLLTLLV
jgi:hypothetical protein